MAWHAKRGLAVLQAGSASFYKRPMNDGFCIWFSYRKAILARVGDRYYMDDRKWSVTTTHHKGKALKDAGWPENVQMMESSEFQKRYGRFFG